LGHLNEPDHTADPVFVPLSQLEIDSCGYFVREVQAQDPNTSDIQFSAVSHGFDIVVKLHSVVVTLTRPATESDSLSESDLSPAIVDAR
jgi:hypothetical protein